VPFFQSCDKELELSPFNQLDVNNAFRTPTDFTNAVRGLYSGLRGGGLYGGTHYIMGDVLADNLILNSEGRKSLQSFHYWTLSGNNTWSGNWNSNYDIINRANFILENIDVLEDGDFKNNIRGQALAVRGLCHFDIVKVYSKFPQHAGGGDLGIPFVVETAVTNKPARPSIAETYAGIIADLEAAKTLVATTNETGALNRAAAYAILSKVYLYTQNYQGAYDAADEAITLGGGVVADQSTFPLIWTDQSDVETVFELKILDSDGISPGVSYSQTGQTGIRSEYNPDFEFYSSYDAKDVRKSAYFVTEPFAGKNFNHIAKYFGRPGGDANVVDGKAIRWAEVFLTRAEAAAETGNTTQAQADLDYIRANRIPGAQPTTATGQELIDEIFSERRKELAFEGHRFFDLKRRGLGVTRSMFGDEADGTGVTYPETAQSLPAGDLYFELPIPQAELNANANMVQNPGY
jgi:hypothetical protein